MAQAETQLTAAEIVAKLEVIIKALRTNLDDTIQRCDEHAKDGNDLAMEQSQGRIFAYHDALDRLDYLVTAAKPKHTAPKVGSVVTAVHHGRRVKVTVIGVSDTIPHPMFGYSCTGVYLGDDEICLDHGQDLWLKRFNQDELVKEIR